MKSNDKLIVIQANKANTTVLIEKSEYKGEPPMLARLLLRRTLF